MFKGIWSVNCPLKARINVWKCARSFIPTKACLFNRRIPKYSQYPRYQFAVENIFARAVWATLNFTNPQLKLSWAFLSGYRGFSTIIILTDTQNLQLQYGLSSMPAINLCTKVQTKGRGS